MAQGKSAQLGVLRENSEWRPGAYFLHTRIRVVEKNVWNLLSQRQIKGGTEKAESRIWGIFRPEGKRENNIGGYLEVHSINTGEFKNAIRSFREVSMNWPQVDCYSSNKLYFAFLIHGLLFFVKYLSAWAVWTTPRLHIPGVAADATDYTTFLFSFIF